MNEEEDKSLISIIIPVYNSERYIQRCLDSVLQQTWKNIEVLIINDGSTDGSYELCLHYNTLYNQVRLYNQNNSGPSVARNLGLTESRGEFVTFLDADDWVEKDWIQKYAERIDANTDVYVCNFIDEYTNYTARHQEYELKDNVQDIFVEIAKKQSMPFLWCKLFRKEIIDKYEIRFDESLRLSEDSIFICEYFLYARKASLANDYSYHYRRNRQDSLSNKKYSVAHYFYVFEKYQQFRCLFNERFGDINVENVFQAFLWSYLQQVLNREMTIDSIRQICNYINRYHVRPLMHDRIISKMIHGVLSFNMSYSMKLWLIKQIKSFEE